jgi:hypothetical protein
MLCADAYHVAAGLLLKLGDQGLAYLAADRSMRAAQASEDPVMIGASARIITHALIGGRHLKAAVSTASTNAQRLERDAASRSPQVLSVYGSLLLRGAVAAAQDDRRPTSRELLDEADRTAKQLGADGNAPSARGLLRDLIRCAPPSVRREAQQFASQIGTSVD